jgi:DnaJ-class molecular chaperone
MAQQIDFDPAVDYYKALGVAQGATADEIKKAYRKLAKAYHPDSTGGDKAKESRFKDISNAYDVLGEPKKRQLYDQIRAGGGGMPGGMGGMGGFGRGASYTTQGGGPGVFDLGDLFQFFGQQGGGGGGGGARGGNRVRVEHFDGGGGRGGGARHVQDADFEQQVRASDGSYLRVEGVDVHSDVRIPFDRAILGTVATVPTIDGKADMKIPPGSSSGRKLRLRGKGINGAGDHYVTIEIDVPEELDDEGKKLLVQLVQHTASTKKRKH